MVTLIKVVTKTIVQYIEIEKVQYRKLKLIIRSLIAVVVERKVLGVIDVYRGVVF